MSYQVFFFSAVASLGLSLGLVALSVGSAPLPPPDHLGHRGYKRLRALGDSELFAALEPTMRWLGRRVYGLLSPGVRRRLDEQLVLTGNVAGLRAEEVVALSILSACALAMLGALYGHGKGNELFFMALLGLLGALAPYLYLSSVAHERLRQITLTTPQVVDLLALSLGAGLDFPAAVRQIVERTVQSTGPLHEELRLVLQDLCLGRTRRQALTALAVRAPCEPITDLVGAVTQAEDQGTPLSEVLRVQAAMARMRRTANAEETAARAATSMLLPLVLLFLCVLILLVGPMVLRLQEQFA